MKEPYSTGDTALLLVDLLNDFLDEKGKLAPRIGEMLDKTNFKVNLKRLINGARAKGVKIFYVPHGLHEHSFDDVRHIHPRWQWAMENKLFWKGDWGASSTTRLRRMTATSSSAATAPSTASSTPTWCRSCGSTGSRRSCWRA